MGSEMCIRDRVKTGISGGSSVPRPLMEDIQKKLKVKDVIIIYGQ